MKQSSLQALIKTNEARLKELYQKAQEEPSSEGRIKLWRVFRDAYDGLAFPGGLYLQLV